MMCDFVQGGLFILRLLAGLICERFKTASKCPWLTDPVFESVKIPQIILDSDFVRLTEDLECQLYPNARCSAA